MSETSGEFSMRESNRQGTSARGAEYRHGAILASDRPLESDAGEAKVSNYPRALATALIAARHATRE